MFANFFVILFSWISLASTMSAPDEDGWVDVPRPDRYIEEFSSNEDSAWVVLFKQMEGEKFFVRFPQDPSYRYFSNQTVFEAEREGEMLRLSVEKRFDKQPKIELEKRVHEIQADPELLLVKVSNEENGGEILYRSHDRWIWEQVFATPAFLYTFHTESEKMDSDSHRKFLSSFVVFT